MLDWGRDGAADVEGEVTVGATETEAVVGERAGGAVEAANDVVEGEAVVGVVGVGDLPGKDEAGIVDEEFAVIAAVDHARAGVAAALTVGSAAVRLLTYHQSVTMTIVRVPHFSHYLPSSGCHASNVPPPVDS